MKKDLSKDLLIDRLNTICHKCMRLHVAMVKDGKHRHCDYIRCDTHCPFYNDLKNSIRGSDNED